MNAATFRAAVERSKATHRAKTLRRCDSCGNAIPTGALLRQEKERATSSGEARGAGSLYVTRRICERCLDARAAGLLFVAVNGGAR